MTIWLWVAAALAFAVLEVATLAFFAAFISAAAVAAAITAAAGGDLLAQSIVFAVVAVVGLAALRPLLMRYMQRGRIRGMISGAEGMIGKVAPVVDPIPGGDAFGHVRIDGENWPAISEDGSRVEEGARVEVTGLRQSMLLVRSGKGR